MKRSANVGRRPETPPHKHALHLTALAIVAAGLSLAAPAAELTVTVRDAAGQPTAAAIRFHDEQGTLHIPDAAIDLGQLGYLYARGALVHYADWTSPRARSQYPYFGSSWFRARHPKDAACFFVDGEFRLVLPAGRYRLVVSKGLEHTPVEREIVLGEAPHTERVTLERWVDMSARGWHSGDGHVHVERTSPAATAATLLWARAEDVRVAHALLMGDARQTYYAQPAFGNEGRAFARGTWLIPGQEDPRTRHLGHTLHLNPPGPLRDPESYYAYGPVFAGNRAIGLSGFAHVGRRRWSFQADRGLTLLAPAGTVDFVEVAQMGYIGVNLWYEFLNLGFRLTAMAGSDVPWGGTIGNARVYAHTGGALDPERWLAAVRAGRTFVTTGPMLEFTVNGEPPGTVLPVRRGERVRVRARTWSGGRGARPVRLELVALGEPVRTVTGEGDLEADTEIVAERSFWITAARGTNRGQLMAEPGFFSGAIATPVYVEVDGQPTRDTERLPELVERRLECLEAIEAWLDASEAGTGGEPGGPGGWESPEAMRASVPAIREQVRAAREFFEALRG